VPSRLDDCFKHNSLNRIRIVEDFFPLVRPRRTWEDNINMDLKEVECDGMVWIDLAQDRDRWCALVNVLMNLLAP
jgi:hypothetical protein